jgi:hypothetical protein
VTTWGSTKIVYDTKQIEKAARLLLDAANRLGQVHKYGSR